VRLAPLITPIPFRDPAAAFSPLADHPMAMLLDSALPGAQARFSYIVADPVRTIRCTPHPWRVTIDGADVGKDPFAVLTSSLGEWRAAPGPIPFMGGAVGFFSYELGGLLERLPAPKTQPWPADMMVGIYDTVAAFDMERREAWIVAHHTPGRARATARTESLATRLGDATPGPPERLRGSWRNEMSRSDYETAVISAIEAIKRGDIYQANITQRFVAEVPSSASSFDLYLRLRAATPAPFAAFINTGDMQLISASPERFLKLSTAGEVETRPIKGTRPRGVTPEEDKALAAALLASAKDRAENLMIADLLRNDLARVCAPGSVQVPVLCGLETFPAVHHLVSVVTARLAEGVHAVDLLRAAFPGGSITGAPKIKAMEVIHALEPAARGPYCGTVAWLGFDGAMDSSIVIRTLVRGGTTVVAQAGGGIVAESDPAREYEESLVKVRPLLAVLDGP
jgi:para-aminobenzoate synthetase component 1